MLHKRGFIAIAALLLPIVLLAGTLQKETRIYKEVEGIQLQLDLYKTDSATILPQPCLVFVFGGGFKEGERDAAYYLPYFQYFANKGFTVASIDYRLGMKGKEAPGLLNFKPLQQAIEMAVTDLYAATNYLLEHADELNIDPSLVIISGSSAGAITVLQADYMERDNHPVAKVLPDDFRYAGVISFAGGIFSKEGLPSYTQRPAPTLFFMAVPTNWYLTTIPVYLNWACSDPNHSPKDLGKKGTPTFFTPWRILATKYRNIP